VTLDVDHIQKLCELSRLAISADEVDDVAAKLSDIVELVDALQAVDTTGVEPMAHPIAQSQRLREDRVTESDEHLLFQQNAPRVERDLYLVPRVLE
jgi:aspartyl-tRNA(Asn)/glutamyl-tRNA(Gln) amidotransferase subunit C